MSAKPPVSAGSAPALTLLVRPVFAHYLRTNARTLENWEQGRAKPNAQASLLIRMVAQFPDMVQRLETI